MGTKFWIRKILVPAAQKALFPDRALKALQTESEVRHTDALHVWRMDGYGEALLGRAARSNVRVLVERSVLIDAAENPNQLEQRKSQEYESIRFFLLASDAFLLLQEPDLGTRAITASALLQFAEARIKGVLQAAGLDVTFVPPIKERSKEWLISRFLEVAAGQGGERVTQVEVRGLSTSKLSETMPLYNPEPDAEEIGRMFMSRANTDIDWSQHMAAEGKDLSHNPLVRAQLGAGAPELIVVRAPPPPGGKRGRAKFFRRKRTDRINLGVRGDEHPSEVVEAARLILGEGDYEVD